MMPWAAVSTKAILDGEVTGSALRVLGYLSWLQGLDADAWPSELNIAMQLDITERSVRTALSLLERKGYVRCTRPQRQGRGLKNAYSVVLEKEEQDFPLKLEKEEQDFPLKLEKEETSFQKRRKSFSKTCAGIRKTNKLHINTPLGIDSIAFEQVRKLYPGTKRGHGTELHDFTRKHPDWREVLPGLAAAIQGQIQTREAKQTRKEFVPAWPHLRTWLSQRRWEEQENASEPGASIPPPQGIPLQVDLDGLTARQRALAEMEVAHA